MTRPGSSSSTATARSVNRPVLAALAANLGVFAAKVIGFLITGSAALLAESLHSLADTGNQALLLWGARRAGVGPSSDHPFGRGREHYFWAFIVGLVLFGVGGVTSIIEGTRKLADATHGVDRPATALVLIGVSAAFEASSFAVGARSARRRLATDVGLWAGLRASRDADLTIVVFEDSGALVGLALAAVGIAISAVTGSGFYDAVATIGIGVLLCAIAVVLAIEMHARLIGEPASDEDLDRLQQAIGSVAGVRSILNLRTEHIGPDDLLVCAKVEFDEPLDRVIELIDVIEANIHEAVPATLTCYIEPDRFDAQRTVDDWT